MTAVPIIGLTGATGFVGAAIAARLLSQGSQVRLLVRDAQRIDTDLSQASSRAERPLEVFEGSLNETDRLAGFTQGLTACIHCAGLTHARRDADFEAVNVAGAADLAKAFAHHSSHDPKGDNEAHRRFVHISSLAARNPSVSAYAMSKFRSEEAVANACGGTPWITLRAPALFGPRDTATLPFFKSVKAGFAPIPGGKTPRRASILYVEDFVDAVLVALEVAPPGDVYEVGDALPDGHSWEQIAHACAEGLDRKTRLVALPKPLLSGWAALSSTVQRGLGQAPMVTPDKVEEFFHADWAARDNLLVEATPWSPRTRLVDGFRKTADWYHAQGWL